MSPTPEGPYLPTSDVVAVAWLAAIDGLDVGQVGTALPVDVSTWLDAGFVQAQTLPGGAADVDLPQWRRPVIQLDFWAAGGASSISPRWNLAARLVEIVRAATESQAYGSAVAMPEHYLGARVQAAYFVTEPRRILDDPSGYARFTTDLALDWVRA